MYVFGRGPNCYLEITVYTMLFDKVACFYSQKCVSSVWESTSDGFFSFFTQYFRLQIVFLEQSRLASGLRRKLSSFPKVFRYYQKCKV